MAIKCPSCYADNPETLKFCGECGTKLDFSTPGHPSGRPPGPADRASFTKTLETTTGELVRGTTFASRYEIIEELGAGGMGRVYRALDTKLNEEVALKLIKPEISADKRVVERFRNELKTARKIRHKNVCGMFDLHEEGKTLFLTMEYVRGEDLKSLLHRTRNLSIGTALSIAHQVAEGLREAHQLGITHRDLKPGNIMIDRDGNAKVMDFGIARVRQEKGVTGEGAIVGTPQYMSPEQVEGKEADARSDIYALGIILFEMLVGRAPFEGETPISIATKHKTEPPPVPKKLVPQISEGLNKLILRCLEKDKAKRYQTAEEFVADLTTVEQALPVTDHIAPRAKTKTSHEITVKFQPKRLVVPASIIIALVVVTAIIFWPRKVSNLDPKLVAVAVFENKTGDPKLDYIGSMAAERVMQGLTQVGQFAVAPMPRAESMPVRLEGKDKFRALAEATRAGKIVHGDYYIQSEAIQFHAWVEDMVNGKNILALEPASGPAKDPVAALEPLRLRLMGGVAGIFSPVLRDWLSMLKEPPSYEAYREYIEGSEAFYRDEYPKAIEHFLRAEERDPNLQVALMYAAVAFLNQNEDAKADELIKEVAKSRAELSTGERLMLDWLETGSDFEASFRICRQIAAKYRTWDWIYQNAYEAIGRNYPQEAVDLLNGLNPFAEVYKERQGSYWGVLARAHHMLGNYRAELKAIRRGRRQYPESQYMLSHELRPLAALGRARDLQNLFKESETLPQESGFSLGLIMLESGKELRAHGFREDAVRVLNQALWWFQKRSGDEKNSRETRLGRAKTLYILGKWSDAKELLEGLQAEVPDDIDIRGYLGATAVQIGDKSGAEKIAKQLEEDKRPYLYGYPTYWRARIAALLGDQEGAVKLLRQATREGFAYYTIHATIDFESLANYPPYIQLMKPRG